MVELYCYCCCCCGGEGRRCINLLWIFCWLVTCIRISTHKIGKLTTANMLHGTSGASIARGTFDITLFSMELGKYVSGVFMLQVGFSISCY